MNPLTTAIKEQVERNCDISDARFWGVYTICGFLLRIRELYRFRSGIEPYRKIDLKDITAWLEERHKLWETLENEDYRPIEIEGRKYDAFDSEGINKAISGLGLMYGAGYGAHMKPVFYLAEILLTYPLNDLKVLMSGMELTRDLSLHPAMLQGRTILARRHITETLIWGKYEEYEGLKESPGSPLHTAFSAYGIKKGISPKEAAKLIKGIAEQELGTYIMHEVGEYAESSRLPVWQEMLALVHGKTAVLMRAVKDTIADTSSHGMLRFIIDGKKIGSLGFYISFLSGARTALVRPVKDACVRFFSGASSWDEVDRARLTCHQKAVSIADELSALYAKDIRRFPMQAEELLPKILTKLNT